MSTAEQRAQMLPRMVKFIEAVYPGGGDFKRGVMVGLMIAEARPEAIATLLYAVEVLDFDFVNFVLDGTAPADYLKALAEVQA